ncbi:fibronectin/fibrinogen-binding protein [Heliorestis acidaminivorans]|uniref:Rqc2 homolog RqcH n=1 Tax=Heliorestis acidaminivorans TaxID=553427 RepID=A0A6I0F680_9FIRM|nr:NFACT RNA binding domain-containing protein [Heliorestis acidaminivorans]KAB2954482.1 fibronectin/fibrinogen-binding protein [Heliorestis acidaminivorans]
MALDGITLHHIVDELKETLITGRIDRIVQPLPEEIHILGRTGAKHWRLLLSVQAMTARLHMTKVNKTNPPQPPLFCMVLRKHLESGRVKKIEQIPWERIVMITVEGKDELGGRSEKKLILEIMGRHSNLILVDEESSAILDGLRRYSHALSRHREVLPGRPYVLPPAQNKIAPNQLNDELLASLLYTEPDKKVVKVLQQQIAGLSMETTQEIIYRAGLNAEITADQCGNYELGRIIIAFRELLQYLDKKEKESYLYWAGDELKTFAPWPLQHLEKTLSKTEKESINETLDAFYHGKESIDKTNQLRQSLQKKVAIEWDKLQRKQVSQTQDIVEAEKYLICRTWGDLILTNLYQLQGGEKVLQAYDLERPEQIHQIPLDVALSPSENAQKYYSRYNKATLTVRQATEQLAKTKNELQYLSSILTMLEQSESLEELAEIKEELVQEGYWQKEKEKEKVKQKKQKQGKQKSQSTQKAAPPPEPLKVEYEGWTILIGRNNRQNEYVTMKLGRDKDLWLHTKDIPGAHVLILRRQDKDVPATVLEIAAAYAAYYSQGRQSTKVPVDFTERRFVRKPSGAKPGFVIYDHQQTIMANPQMIYEKTSNL